MWWTYSYILELQRCNRWSLGMDKSFHPASYWACLCLSWHDDVIKWKHFPRYWPFVWGIHRGQKQQKSLPDIGGTNIQDVGPLAPMEFGVHTMSNERILQISCSIFLAFKWILVMRSGNDISHCTTSKLLVHVWNHDLIWWQNETDTQNIITRLRLRALKP